MKNFEDTKLIDLDVDVPKVKNMSLQVRQNIDDYLADRGGGL